MLGTSYQDRERYVVENMSDEWRFDTRNVHLPGERTREDELVPPIFQAATFRLETAQEGAEKSLATHPEKFYTRWGNPTTKVLEDAVAEMEGGEKALAASSGMGAISTAVITLLGEKKHVVAGETLYAGTEELLTRILPGYDVETTFVDPTEPSNFRAATREDTGLYYLESPANPTLTLTDLKKVAETGEDAGVPVVVDNTFATPYNQRPIDLGVDVVVHSATKYLGGHLDATGGIVVSDEEFYQEAWETVKIFGPTLSPMESWLLIRGLRTFSLRMERHNSNAEHIATFLEERPGVEKVYYPGLESNPQRELAERQMTGYGGMVSFELSGYQEGKRFVEEVELCRLAVSLGGVKTLVEHPASMTHGMLTEEERRKAGISEGLIRLSIGTENPDDIREDIEDALSHATP